MGRPVSSDPDVTLLSASAIPAHTAHLAVSVVYALAILAVVYRLRTWRAILGGIVTSLVLYGINFAVFRAFAPEFTGAYEFNVVLAHVLFGGIVAGVIRGSLRSPMGLDQTQPNPGAQLSPIAAAHAASETPVRCCDDTIVVRPDEQKPLS